jgi:hypothetical protein
MVERIMVVYVAVLFFLAVVLLVYSLTRATKGKSSVQTQYRIPKREAVAIAARELGCYISGLTWGILGAKDPKTAEQIQRIQNELRGLIAAELELLESLETEEYCPPLTVDGLLGELLGGKHRVA